MERTRLPSLKPRLRPISLEIRSRANLLPFKALIYVTTCAVLKSPKSSKVRLRENYRNLSNSIKLLNTYAVRLYGAADHSPLQPPPDPDSMTDMLRTAVENYVSLFYSMNTAERTAYIRSMSTVRHRVKRESNMLFIPAILGEAGEDQKTVKTGLFKHLYAMPFRMLYTTSKAGLRLMLMQNGMAIKSMNYEMVHEFSKLVSVLDSKILEIDDGKINPVKDEELKGSFIDQAVKMSKETDINIVEIISDKVRTESQIVKEAQRLVRRAVYINRAR